MKKYVIKMCSSKNEINWDKVPLANIDENGWNSIPKYESYAQVVFIEDFGFIVKLSTNEKKPWALCQNDGGPVYLDSCLEAFFKFNEEGYINLENNSLGKRLQGFGKDRHGRQSILDCNLISIPNKSNNEWSIILEIPLEKLGQIYKNLDVKNIKSGFEFKGNFYKTGKNPTNGEEHYYMWNRINTDTPDFHQPNEFGSFIIDSDFIY